MNLVLILENPDYEAVVQIKSSWLALKDLREVIEQAIVLSTRYTGPDEEPKFRIGFPTTQKPILPVVYAELENHQQVAWFVRHWMNRVEEEMQSA